MCGLAGYVALAREAETRAALPAAVAALRRRGPDGQGFHYASRAGLGHARLAIIDLATGDQPLFNEDRTLALVVNGEFYNYRELTPGLLQSGHRPRTKSDSEIFLHLYEDRPLDRALAALNGMWALALWDENRGRLLLSRDRAGKKPLYYALTRDRIVFASEIKSVLAFPGVDRETDHSALALYLKYGYVPAPYSIYRSIRKLPAASYATYADGRLEIHRYWELPEAEIRDRTPAEWLNLLDETLEDAVRLRLVADVPLGVFLSGGLDSSLIASRVARIKGGQGGNERVKTFSIGFDDPSYDETAHAMAMANRLGTDHHVHRVGFDNLDLLPTLAAHFDEPFADSSCLPTWHLCRATRAEVTVALSGDGGDELFGGYRRYLAGRWTGRYLGLPRALRAGLIEPAVDWLPAPDGYYGRSMAKKAKLFVAAARRLATDPGAVSPLIFDPGEIDRLFPGLPRPAIEDDPPARAALAGRNRDLVTAMQRADFGAYLPDDILVKVDRMSMYHALEVRCPFLDHRLVELAHAMPPELKVTGFRTKVLLKRLALRELPADIVNRSKQGFMVPLDVWFRGESRNYVREVLAASRAPWDKSAALELWQEHQDRRQDHSSRLWALTVLALWSGLG